MPETRRMGLCIMAGIFAIHGVAVAQGEFRPRNYSERHQAAAKPQMLGYTFANGECVYWSGGGVLADYRTRRERDCAAILSALTQRHQFAIDQRTLYQAQSMRVVVDCHHFASGASSSCVWTIAGRRVEAGIGFGEGISMLEALTGRRWDDTLAEPR